METIPSFSVVFRLLSSPGPSDDTKVKVNQLGFSLGPPEKHHHLMAVPLSLANEAGLW